MAEIASPPPLSSGAAPSGVTARVLAEVAVDELDLRFAPLRLVAPGAQARLRASVEREGIRDPVLASTAVEVGRTVLVDGIKRVRVARDLRIAKLWANLVAVDTAASLSAMLSANAPHAGLTAIEQGWIVRTLCRDLGLTQKAAGDLVGHDQSWVSLRVRLVEDLEKQLQDDLRLGLLSPTQARELGRLPRGREQLETSQAVQRHGLSSRQTTQVVDLLLDAGEPRVRRGILADPLGCLARAKEVRVKPAVDPRLSRPGQELAQGLAAWEAASWRLGRLLTPALSPEDAMLLSSALAQALATGRRALERLEARARTAGERTTDVQGQAEAP
jgi:ParB-like chromosome segregation protein Spo0J